MRLDTRNFGIIVKKQFVRGQNNKSLKTDYYEKFKQDGIASFTTENTELISKQILNKLKKLEKNNKNIWNIQNHNKAAHQSYNGNCWVDFPEIAHFFQNDVGAFLRDYFECDFKIFYSSMFKSVGYSGSNASGSQLWHSDGGPGSCVIIAIYLNDTTEKSGCLEALDWSTSLSIFEEEKTNFGKFIDQYCDKNSILKDDLGRSKT